MTYLFQQANYLRNSTESFARSQALVARASENMNRVRYLFVAAVLSFAFSEGKIPDQKICCMRGKTRDKYICKGRFVALSAEMARVAEVGCGNFVCEFHWHQLLKSTKQRLLLSTSRAFGNHEHNSNTGEIIQSV